MRHIPFLFGLTLVVATVQAGATELTAQDLHPSRRPSPVGIAKTHLGETYVKVTYGRPYMRDRTIFGPDGGEEEYLVPFGVLWRTGANEATELTTTGPLTVGSEPLPAGTYAVFTVPGPERWRIHFSPQLGLDGTGMLTADGEFTPDVYDPTRDVLVVEVPSGSLEEELEQLTISFDPDESRTAAHLVLAWENTEVRIPIAAR